jgi:hypothetical protein
MVPVVDRTIQAHRSEKAHSGVNEEEKRMMRWVSSSIPNE